MPTPKNINVLRKDIKADTLPLEYAVNIPDTNIFIPATKKASENNINPSKLISNKLVPLVTNTDINIYADILESTNVIIPKAEIIIKLYLTSLDNCSLSLLP